MKNQTNLFVVVQEKTVYFNDGTRQTEQKRHTTYAVSARKAINNVKYRTKKRERTPESSYSPAIYERFFIEGEIAAAI